METRIVVFMLHVLTTVAARPDRVYKTGVIQPFPGGGQQDMRPDRISETGVVQPFPPRGQRRAARPDRVIKTGVVQPFPLNLRPATTARQTIAEFVNPGVGLQANLVGMGAQQQIRPSLAAKQTIASFVAPVRPLGPVVSNEPQPEEIAMMAERIAAAMANGKTFRRTVDPRLIKAAQLLIEGKSFVIKSAGRQAIIKASTRFRSDPMSYTVR